MAVPFHFNLETIVTDDSILESVIANPDVIGMWQSYTLPIQQHIICKILTSLPGTPILPVPQNDIYYLSTCHPPSGDRCL
jgi:hypothetical protein